MQNKHPKTTEPGGLIQRLVRLKPFFFQANRDGTITANALLKPKGSIILSVPLWQFFIAGLRPLVVSGRLAQRPAAISSVPAFGENPENKSGRSRHQSGGKPKYG